MHKDNKTGDCLCDDDRTCEDCREASNAEWAGFQRNAAADAYYDALDAGLADYKAEAVRKGMQGRWG